jgi:hypothetical protein
MYRSSNVNINWTITVPTQIQADPLLAVHRVPGARLPVRAHVVAGGPHGTEGVADFLVGAGVTHLIHGSDHCSLLISINTVHGKVH